MAGWLAGRLPCWRASGLTGSLDGWIASTMYIGFPTDVISSAPEEFAEVRWEGIVAFRGVSFMFYGVSLCVLDFP